MPLHEKAIRIIREAKHHVRVNFLLSSMLAAHISVCIYASDTEEKRLLQQVSIYFRLEGDSMHAIDAMGESSCPTTLVFEIFDLWRLDHNALTTTK